MKFLSQYFLAPLAIILLLSACSPHSGSGVWKAVTNNDQGIAKLTVGFDGRAEFIASQQNNTLWHCFWTAIDRTKLALDCTPSTNPKQEQSFVLNINEQGQAELRTGTTLLATFKRLDENPSAKK